MELPFSSDGRTQLGAVVCVGRCLLKSIAKLENSRSRGSHKRSLMQFVEATAGCSQAATVQGEANAVCKLLEEADGQAASVSNGKTHHDK